MSSLNYGYKTKVLKCISEDDLAYYIAKTANEFSEEGWRLIDVYQLATTTHAIRTFEVAMQDAKGNKVFKKVGKTSGFVRPSS